MAKGFEHAGAWIEKAKNDLLNADNNLASEQIPYDTVCFHCQQAAEKLLKAYLVAHNKAYPITHNLFTILEYILEYDSTAENFRESLAILNPYSVEVRYPGDAWMPAPSDAKEARQAVQEIYNWVKSKLGQFF